MISQKKKAISAEPDPDYEVLWLSYDVSSVQKALNHLAYRGDENFLARLKLFIDHCRREHLKNPVWTDLDDEPEVLVGIAIYWLRDDKALDTAKKSGWLHNIVGNPFRDQSFRKEWLSRDVRVLIGAWLNGETCALELSDALIDAGCDNDDIVHHLRCERRCPMCLRGTLHILACLSAQELATYMAVHPINSS